MVKICFYLSSKSSLIYFICKTGENPAAAQHSETDSANISNLNELIAHSLAILYLLLFR